MDLYNRTRRPDHIEQTRPAPKGGIMTRHEGGAAASRLRQVSRVRGAGALAIMLAGLLLAACGGGGGGAPTDGHDGVGQQVNYFPLAADQRRVYLHEGTTTEEVEDTASYDAGTNTATLQTAVHGDQVSALRGAQVTGGPFLVMQRVDDTFGGAIGWVPLIKGPVATGASWVQVDKTGLVGDADGDGKIDTVAIHSVVTVIGLESVATPAGHFDGALHLRTVIDETVVSGADNVTRQTRSTVDDWYAPDIGLVRSTTVTGTGAASTTDTVTLQSYRLGSRVSDTKAPGIVATAPGSTGVENLAHYSISAQFDESIDPDSLSAGGFTLVGSDGKPIDCQVLVDRGHVNFWPRATLPDGTYTATLGTGVTDLVGHPLAAPRSWSFTFDTSLPAVLSSSPAPGGVVDPQSSLVLNFSEAIDPAGLVTNAFDATVWLQYSDRQGGVSGTNVAATVEGDTMTVTPDFWLRHDTDYVLQMYVPDMHGNPGSVTIPFRTAPGRFSAPESTAGVDAGTAVAVADVNGDGVNDIVYAGYYVLSVSLGHADGTHDAPTVVYDGSAEQCELTSLAVGDLTGDGRNDVVVGSWDRSGFGGCGAILFRQGADGTLARTDMVDSTHTQIVRVADVNGDGRPDLIRVLQWPDSDKVLISLQDVDGQLVDQPPLSLAVPIGDLVVKDMNGDGRPDLVAAYIEPYNSTDFNSTFYHLSVTLQQPDGSFGAPQIIFSPEQVTSFAVGDLDHDGRPDIVTAVGADNVAFVNVYHQTADGSFQQRTQPTLPNSSPVAIADLDGDGRDDLIVAYYLHGGFSVFLQQVDGTLGPQDFYDGSNARNSIVVGDASNDGRPDILTGSALVTQRAVVDAGPDAGHGVAHAMAQGLRRGAAHAPLRAAAMSGSARR
jgi:hypothetical protein